MHAVPQNRATPLRQASLMRVLDDATAPAADAALPGAAALLGILARRLDAAETGRGALIVLQLQGLDELAALAGEAAAARACATAAARLAGFAAGRHPVADLGAGRFVLVSELPAEHALGLARHVAAALAQPLRVGRSNTQLAVASAVHAIDAARGDAHCHLATALDLDLPGLDPAREPDLGAELALAYQPIFPADGRGPIKAEALLRCAGGTPDQFIPRFEETGMIHAVGEWVLRAACLQAREWQAAGVRIAVNVSPVQLESVGFVAMAGRIVRETGCDPRAIELEMTEGALVRDIARTAACLEALAAIGFTLAIDDFGAGYSSLGLLAQLPVHHLKIDRSLVRGLAADPRKAGIVDAVLAMAEALGITTTVEGIEHQAQVDHVSRYPNVHLQGYLLGRPMAAHEVRALARRHAGAPLALAA